MSIDNLDDTSDSPIQFGLADKSLKILQEHSRRLEAMVTAVKGTVGAGAGSQFSGKFLQVAQQQLIVQKDVAQGIRQLNMQFKNMAGLQRQVQHMDAINRSKAAKLMQTYLTGIGGTKSEPSRFQKIFAFFKNIPHLLSRGIKAGFRVVSKIWEKTGGALFKKTGSMGINKLLGLGGATVIGALVGKMISSSPLLQAMFKILNTSLTLIMRPIGDFFGAFFRPMFIYFLKEVAIPFFQQGRGWMKDGEKWGRIAVGFFIDPVMAMQSAILGSFNVISKWLGNLLLPGFGGGGWGTNAAGEATGALAEAQFFQQDPAAWLRFKEGLTGGSTPWLMPGDLAGATPEQEIILTTMEDLEAEIERLKEELKTANTTPPSYTQGQVEGIAGIRAGGYPSGISDEVIGKIYPWLAQGQSEAEYLQEQIFLQKLNLATQEEILDETKTIAQHYDDTKAQTDASHGRMWGSIIGEGSGADFLGQISASYQRGGVEFWKRVGDAIGGVFKSVSAYSILPSVYALNEPFDEAKYEAEQQAELFESITRSFVTMEEYNQQSAQAAHNFFLNQARNQMSTAASIDMSNKGILTQYDMTMEELYNNADSLKERLYKVYTIYEAISRNADLISYNDQVTADARALSMELQLDFTEEMLTATTNIKANYGKMADSILQNYLDIGYFQNISRNAMQEAVGTILKTTDDVQKILTGEPGTLSTEYNKMIATKGGILSTPQLVGGGFKGIGGTVPGVGSLSTEGYSPLDLRYAQEQGYSGIYGPNPLQTMGELAGEGKAITPTGNIQEFFKYQGPEGQSFDQMWKVPKITGPQGSLIMDPNWRRVADAENAFLSAIGYANQSAAAKLNEAAAKIKAGTDTFTNANQSAVYVASGGGLAGLAAVEAMGTSTGNLPGVNTTGPSYGSWMVSQGGALGQAIKESQAANPQGWATATGIASSYFSGGGGSGQGSNYSGSSNPAAAAAAAGYSTGSPTNAQFGGIIDEPIVGIGMHSGREWNLGESGAELVTPLNQLQDGGGLGNIIIHIGNISKEADYMKLKPLIQRWILEASSRRGMV